MGTPLTEEEHDDAMDMVNDGCDCADCFVKVPGNGILAKTTSSEAYIASLRGKYPYSYKSAEKTPQFTPSMVWEAMGEQHRVIISDVVAKDIEMDEASGNILIEFADCIVECVWYSPYGDNTNNTTVSVTTYAGSNRRAQEVTAQILGALPAVPEPDADIIHVSFWTNTVHGPSSMNRKLKATDPADLELNYSAETKAALKELLSRGPESITGRIILLHGDPGVGKSYFVRLLLRSWKNWCKGNYLVDADQFFGVASYMTKIVFEQSKDDEYRLIIAEDADEFISADSKSVVGQSVSRLFNLADGMVGQGTNTIILMSTNEPVERFHKAILRPGRSLANIQFGPLSTAEANTWLEAHDMPADATEPTTLATLYEKLGKGRVTSRQKAKKGLGFT